MSKDSYIKNKLDLLPNEERLLNGKKVMLPLSEDSNRRVHNQM